LDIRMNDAWRIGLIGLGGGLGAICRYLAGIAATRWLGSSFAYGTLGVNVVGCLLMGVLMALAARLNHLLLTTLTVGFLGGLTTFSAFGYETVRYLQAEEYRVVALNIAANVLLGCAAVLVGLAIGKSLG
jgi:fluoride exporter